MTYNPYDRDHEKSSWAIGAANFEGIVGERMRAKFAPEDDQLPTEMVHLLRRLEERETLAPRPTRRRRRWLRQ